MKHRKKGRKLNRSPKARQALFKTLLNSFFENGEITTTLAKAKVIQKDVDRLINKAKEGTLQEKRFIFASLSPGAAKNLVEKIAPQAKNRQSGYSRLFKLGQRQGDGAMMAKVELVDKIEEVEEKKKAIKEKKGAEKSSPAKKKRTRRETVKKGSEEK
ncbi:MAG TPA: 50S ribosomal protein L17 [Candidatus Woesebacteria bacterium]|nr:50S ribosomal protein L17 [Candidatus Woesebacteria bacterium]